MKYTVQLNPWEIRIATFIGTARQKANIEAGLEETKVGKESAFYYHVCGVAAEIMVAKLLNVYPDFENRPRLGSDLIYNNLGIDVKHTIYPLGKLLVTAKKRNDMETDIYVLVTGELDDLSVAGWIRTYDVMQEKYWNRFPQHGPGWHVLQEELESMDAL